MRNMDFPVHQAVFENASALYAARYAETSRRIADNNPDEVFTTYMHDEMRGAEFFSSLGDSGLTIVGGGDIKMMDPRLDKTLDEITTLGGQVDPDMELSTPERELKIIELVSSQFVGSHVVEQLQWLGVLTLIASYNKPAPAIAEAVIRQRTPEEPAEYEVFRRAVRRLRSHQLNSGEEESITSNYDKFMHRINTGGSKAPRAVATLNRYQQGRFIGKMLDRLMDPSFRRAHVIDEITYQVAPEPRHIPSTPGYTTPIIKLPWSMLAKARKERDSPKRTGGASSPQPEEIAEPAETIALTHQTAWVDDLAETWEHGGQRTRVDKLPTGNRKRPYQGALLNNRYGKPVVHVVDTAEPENALYYAVEGEVRDPDTGELIPVLDAFEGNKPQARARGARRIEHAGKALDFYKDLMDRVRADVERSEQRHRAAGGAGEPR